MTRKVDLVLVFRSYSGKVLTKPQARENARQATEQYKRLLDTLKNGGLRAVGKRGEREGQLLVLVACPRSIVTRLAQRERHTDFLCGLPTRNPTSTNDVSSQDLSPADRLRLVYTYVTSTPQDGGLGIGVHSTNWDRVESIMTLHDHAFNEAWIRSWTTRQLLWVRSDDVREQFGEAVAYYFAFLSFYTRFLVFISAIGVYFYFFGMPYSPTYSSVLLLWSITFVESWRIKQKKLGVRWGTLGSFRVEKRRAQYIPISWWNREARMLAGLPVIAVFAAVLAVILTGIFLFEAFVMQLYTGPGHRFISFSPTILFALLVPRLLSIYHSYAVAFTNWENHGHQSTHDASLTLKTFSLSAIVAYSGIALSAFVYVPFGESVMTFVQSLMLKYGATIHEPIVDFVLWAFPNITATTAPHLKAQKDIRGSTGSASRTGLWDADGIRARSKLNPSRLQDQMFAFMVTNQVVNTFLEIGLPFILRAVDSVRSGKKLALMEPAAGAADLTKKKRVMFEDDDGHSQAEISANGTEEKLFLERIRREVALPEYNLFADYSEMVTQFGHVALWSTIWPLAPLMSLLNNWLELRSDAFKIAVHARRPVPSRTDTIGPWIESLAFITWLSALTNSALVYLFRPQDHCRPLTTTLVHEHHHISTPSASSKELLGSALLVALAASHGYIVVRGLIRHVLERMLWRGSKEQQEMERIESVVKKDYLRSIGVADVVDLRPDGKVVESPIDPDQQGHFEAFWAYDEGLEELSRDKES